MISIGLNNYEKLKEKLRTINVKRKKKRVTDTRLHLTQYLSHAIPLSAQRLVLSPFNRSYLLSQIGCESFKSLFDVRNTTPLSVLKGSYRKFGFANLWKGTTSHILSGVVFPGFYILSRWISNLTYIPKDEARRYENFRRYLETLSLCTFSHLFSYPFDTCYTRIASDYRNSHKIKAYLRETVRNRGISSLYSGFSLCLLSTATHLLITLPLNRNIQYRAIENINEKIAKNPILRKNVKAIKPKELEPVELFPFNLIFGTASAFVAKTVTYPIDTLKVKWQYHARNNAQDFRGLVSLLKVHTPQTAFQQNRGHILPKLYAGFSMKCLLFLPESVLYGTIYAAAVKFLA